MAIKLRRGTDAERQGIVFEQAEIVYTTDTKKVYIGDGLTSGGNIVSGQPSLGTLDDVQLGTLANSNFLRYNADTTKWENVSVTTDNISEGVASLYYTAARFDTRFATKTTDDLAQGVSNLYFTDTKVYDKVKSVLSAGSNTSISFDDEAETLTVASQGNVQSVNGYSGTITLDSDDISEGSTNLYFSDSKVTSAISSSIATNSGIALEGSNLTTTYNTTIGDDVNSVAAGGADPQPASYWKSKTIVEVLDDILFPTILASIRTNESLSLSVSGDSGSIEVGRNISRTLTANFNPGLIENGDGSNGPQLVGSASSYTFTGESILSTTQASDQLNIDHLVVEGSNNWEVTASYGNGPDDYTDNKGNFGDNLDASRVGGTISDLTSSPSITGIYPYFWGVSVTEPSLGEIATAIQNGTANKVVASASGTVTVNFNASGRYLWMAHYAEYDTKQKWYISALNNGDIGSASDLFGVVSTRLVDSPDNYWSDKLFKVYRSTFATSVSSDLEFRNS